MYFVIFGMLSINIFRLSSNTHTQFGMIRPRRPLGALSHERAEQPNDDDDDYQDSDDNDDYSGDELRQSASCNSIGSSMWRSDRSAFESTGADTTGGYEGPRSTPEPPPAAAAATAASAWLTWVTGPLLAIVVSGRTDGRTGRLIRNVFVTPSPPHAAARLRPLVGANCFGIGSRRLRFPGAGRRPTAAAAVVRLAATGCQRAGRHR